MDVLVEVTDKRAIYVNNTRITDRGTKWGVHTTIDSFKSPRSSVVKTCLSRGHLEAVRRIDDPVYVDQRQNCALDESCQEDLQE